MTKSKCVQVEPKLMLSQAIINNVINAQQINAPRISKKAEQFIHLYKMKSSIDPS